MLNEIINEEIINEAILKKTIIDEVMTNEVILEEQEEKSKEELETDAFLNQATLDYLINKKQYKLHLTNAINKKINKKDIKFYRKRILNLSKDLLLKEDSEISVFPDIKCAFEIFLKTCINYFKILDRNDIIQKEYNNIDIEINPDIEIKEKTEINDSTDFLKEENNKLLMRSVKMSNSHLDKFIKIKMTKQQEGIIIPQQKEINLKDPILKNKGIIKKKNIINNYDEDTKKQANKI